MNCFDCAAADWPTPAVAVCHDCGAAVCADHAVSFDHHLTRTAIIDRRSWSNHPHGSSAAASARPRTTPPTKPILATPHTAVTSPPDADHRYERRRRGRLGRLVHSVSAVHRQGRRRQDDDRVGHRSGPR